MTFQELLTEIREGRINQADVHVQIDNDVVNFLLPDGKDDFDLIEVEEGNAGPEALLYAALAALGFTDVYSA